MSRRTDGAYDRRLLVGAGLVLYACWVGGTVIGAVAGDALGDPADLGLDAAFPAIADHERASVECVRHPELALEQVSYEAARARRQYDAVKSGEPTGRR